VRVCGGLSECVGECSGVWFEENTIGWNTHTHSQLTYAISIFTEGILHCVCESLGARQLSVQRFGDLSSPLRG